MNPSGYSGLGNQPAQAVSRQVRSLSDMEGWHAVQSTLLKAVCDAKTVQGVRDATDALFHARLMFRGVAESADPR